MVTEMNRLSVLLYHGEKENFLEKLRDVGVVHIECKDKELDAKASAINGELIEVQKVISDIKLLYKKLDKTSDSKKDNIADTVKKYLSNSARIDAINNEFSAITKERKRFDPWGDVNPDTIKKLAENGIRISLFELSPKDKPLLQSINYEVVKETPTNLWIAAVEENKDVVIEGKEAVHLPQTTFAQLNNQESLLNAEKHKLTTEQEEIAAQIKLIERYKAKLQDGLNYEIASSSMETAAKEKLFCVDGWIPKKKQAQVQQTLDEFSCWYDFNEPTGNDDVPVEFHNNAFAEKYEILTRLFSLPKYYEIDPTPFFAPFYTLFFGFCLGDVGYGALVLFAAIIAYIKAGPKLKPLAVLGVMLGFSTILGGFLLNGFFGEQIFNSADGEGLLGASEIGVASLLKSAAVRTPEILQNGEHAVRVIMPMIPFALFLGIFQILFGMTIRTINRLMQNNWNFQYALYPIGTMFLTVAATLAVTKANFLDMASLFDVLFGVTAMQVDASITANSMLIPLAIGLVLLFLFNNPSKPVFLRVPLGLWEFYQFATGLMGDGLSYIRLFALGLAGGLLGQSFNKIALMICGGEFNFATPLIIPTIFVLLFGHGINFLLACLGSFVHPLRLTFVEFYKHIEFQGGAREYKPFSKTEA